MSQSDEEWHVSLHIVPWTLVLLTDKQHGPSEQLKPKCCYKCSLLLHKCPWFEKNGRFHNHFQLPHNHDHNLCPPPPPPLVLLHLSISSSAPQAQRSHSRAHLPPPPPHGASWPLLETEGQQRGDQTLMWLLTKSHVMLRAAVRTDGRLGRLSQTVCVLDVSWAADRPAGGAAGDQQLLRRPAATRGLGKETKVTAEVRTQRGTSLTVKHVENVLSCWVYLHTDVNHFTVS